MFFGIRVVNYKRKPISKVQKYAEKASMIFSPLIILFCCCYKFKYFLYMFKLLCKIKRIFKKRLRSFVDIKKIVINKYN